MKTIIIQTIPAILALGLLAMAVRSALHRNILAAILGTLGAFACAVLAWQVYTHDNITKMTNGILISFEVTPRIAAIGFAVAAALGLIACIAPAIAVARMSVVKGLKTLD